MHLTGFFFKKPKLSLRGSSLLFQNSTCRKEALSPCNPTLNQTQGTREILASTSCQQYLPPSSAERSSVLPGLGLRCVLGTAWRHPHSEGGDWVTGSSGWLLGQSMTLAGKVPRPAVRGQTQGPWAMMTLHWCLLFSSCVLSPLPTFRDHEAITLLRPGELR